ncbi:MAG TPA: hypothetical protein VIS74_06300 [Chthoniobacterales bacterium]
MENPAPEFRGGEVRVGWNADGLWTLARMEDECIFTQATRDNEKLWLLGDVFEIFVRDMAGEEYLELHAAPTGHRLQLCFASDQVIEHLRNGHLEVEELMVDEPLFCLKVRTAPDCWEVLACVSAIKGRALRASFSRYDYRDADTPPVLSSTSMHREVNYHRQHEWAELRLVGQEVPLRAGQG